MRELVRISVYINEADEWHHKPLHLEVLRMLHDRGVSGGTVLRAVAGFTAKGDVETTSLVDVGGKLPLVIEFIDSPAHADGVMAELRQMVGSRLIVRERVQAL
jgi:PII-like signaling protein